MDVWLMGCLREESGISLVSAPDSCDRRVDGCVEQEGPRSRTWWRKKVDDT